jgi:hypothetical protein
VPSQRFFGWLSVAEDALRPLALPRTNVATSDRAVDRLLRSSAIVAAAQAAGGWFVGAWLTSRTRSIVSHYVPLLPPKGRARVSAVTVVVVVAAFTAFVLEWTAGAAGR